MGGRKRKGSTPTVLHGRVQRWSIKRPASKGRKRQSQVGENVAGKSVPFTDTKDTQEIHRYRENRHLKYMADRYIDTHTDQRRIKHKTRISPWSLKKNS